MTLVFACLFGAMVGSFLNVCIHRLPKEESIVAPRSRCPACQSPIRPWDNVPLLSFVLLRGRCRACRHPISWRYPLVEALTERLRAYGYAIQDLQYVGFCEMVFRAEKERTPLTSPEPAHSRAGAA